MSGATALAEGHPRFKVDVNLVFGNEKQARDCVLRTTLDRLEVWKAKYADVSISPREVSINDQVKDAAVIDGELWVFGIDATRSQDIVTAIRIAKKHFNVRAIDLFGDVYIKNLNAEREYDIAEMGELALVRANKSLYKSTCAALHEAASKMNIRSGMNLWVFSNSKNPKLPKEDLHEALTKGGAKSVETDSRAYRYPSGSNDGARFRMLKTNLHLASISF